MLLVLLGVFGQCELNHNAATVDRRACAFGSYQVFKAHVQLALERLGCADTGTACSDCSLATLDDCETFGVLAAYSEEANDPGLEAIQAALSQCIDPSLPSTTSASLAAAIRSSPPLACSKAGNVDSAVVMATTLVVATSAVLFTWSVVTKDPSGGNYGTICSSDE